MLQKDEIIVLGIVPYKEQNKVLKTFCKSKGLNSYFVPKGKKGSQVLFSVFSILEILSEVKSGNSLSKILECKSSTSLFDIRFNIHKSTVAMLLAEVLSNVIQEEETNTELFNFLQDSILILEQAKEKFANFHLHFLCQLTKFLGISPSNETKGMYFNISEGTFTNVYFPSNNFMENKEAQYFYAFLNSNWEEAKNITMNHLERNLLLDQIFAFYKAHVPGFKIPRSLEILIEINRS